MESLDSDQILDQQFYAVVAEMRLRDGLNIFEKAMSDRLARNTDGSRDQLKQIERERKLREEGKNDWGRYVKQ